MSSRGLPALFIGFLAAASPMLAVPQLPPEAVLAISGTTGNPEPLAVWRLAPDGGAEAVAVRQAQGSQSGRFAVGVGCVPGDYFVQARSQVSRPFRLDADSCGRTLDVALVPAATVRGRVVLPAESAAPPPAASASLDRAPGPLVTVLLRECAEVGPGIEVGRFRTRAAGDGQFATLVPAGCVQLGVRVATFAPIPPVALTLEPGETRDLGTVSLRRGATLTVTARFHGAPAPGMVVAVVPSDEFPDVLDRFISVRRAPEGTVGTTGRDGTAAFVGIPPGTVHVIAIGIDRLGLAGPLDLPDANETNVDALELRGAASATVSVVGDRSWVQDRLQVVAIPLATELGLGADSSVSFGYGLPGEPYSRPLPLPGRWRFELRASDLVLDWQQVDVPAETSVQVQLSADRMRFRGRVLVGNEPAAGSLTLLAGESRDVVARLETEPDGRFTAALPEPGRYTALFSRQQDGIQYARAAAEFVPDREATVRILATRLEGTVAFADGRPARDAIVTVERSGAQGADDPAMFGEHLPTVTTDPSGAFLVRSLEPGGYELSARLGGRKSDPVTAAVGESGTPAVQLVLPDADGVTLRILDARGEPLPNIAGWVMAPGARYGAMPQASSFQTDVEGAARVAVWWRPGTAMQVVVTDPGYPVAALRAILGDDGMLTLTMPPAAGRLRMAAPRRAPEAGAASEFATMALVGDRGAMVPLSLLIETGVATATAGRDSTTLTIPALGTGEWQLGSFADSQAMFLSYSSGASPVLLRSFSVPPGGGVAVEIR